MYQSDFIIIFVSDKLLKAALITMAESLIIIKAALIITQAGEVNKAALMYSTSCCEI